MSAVQAIENANKDILQADLREVFQVRGLSAGKVPVTLCRTLPAITTLHIPHPLHHQHHHLRQFHHSLPQNCHVVQHRAPSIVQQRLERQPLVALEHEHLDPFPSHRSLLLQSHDHRVDGQARTCQPDITTTDIHSLLVSSSDIPDSPMSSNIPLCLSGVLTSSANVSPSREISRRAVDVGMSLLPSVELTQSSHPSYLCVTCLKGFRSRQQLAQHLLVHTNVRRYLCAYCDRTFKQLSHLQQHTRIHTGEKPYCCQFDGCRRAFAQLSNLQHHMRNHEDHVKREATRIHKCLICHRSYTNEGSLRAHTLKMHIHIRHLPEERRGDDEQTDGGRRRRRNRVSYCAPTMVPLAVGVNGAGSNACEGMNFTHSSSDDDSIDADEKERLHIDLHPDYDVRTRSLVETLNRYERELSSAGRKLHEAGAAGVKTADRSSSHLMACGMRPGAAAAGLQGLMGLSGISPAFMLSQTPEVIERAAAAAAAAITNQFLHPPKSVGYGQILSGFTLADRSRSQPLPAHNHVGPAKAVLTAPESGSVNCGRSSSSPPGHTVYPWQMTGVYGGSRYTPRHRPYAQVTDAHFLKEVDPISLGPTSEQFYSHRPPFGRLSPSAHFLGHGVRTSSPSYASQISCQTGSSGAVQLSDLSHRGGSCHS